MYHGSSGRIAAAQRPGKLLAPRRVIEAKPEGTPLVEVERQSGKYVEGLPAWMKPPGLSAAIHLRVHRIRDPVHQRL
jgi:hypothetical protein